MCRSHPPALPIHESLFLFQLYVLSLRLWINALKDFWFFCNFLQFSLLFSMAFLLSRVWKFEHFLVVIVGMLFESRQPTTTPILIQIPKCFLNAFSFNFLLGKFNFPSQSLRDIELNYWYFHLHDDELRTHDNDDDDVDGWRCLVNLCSLKMLCRSCIIDTSKEWDLLAWN